MTKIIPVEDAVVDIDYPLKGQCYHCGGGFSYEFEDVINRRSIVMGIPCEADCIICPTCNSFVCLTAFKPIEGEN